MGEGFLIPTAFLISAERSIYPNCCRALSWEMLGGELTRIVKFSIQDSRAYYCPKTLPILSIMPERCLWW
jgi:hypothetical protein